MDCVAKENRIYQHCARTNWRASGHNSLSGDWPLPHMGCICVPLSISHSQCTKVSTQQYYSYIDHELMIIAV